MVRPVQSDDDDDSTPENVYEVQAILADRKVNGVREYLIQWKDTPEVLWSLPEYNTWEVEENLQCRSLLAAYKKRKKREKREGRKSAEERSATPPPATAHPTGTPTSSTRRRSKKKAATMTAPADNDHQEEIGSDNQSTPDAMTSSQQRVVKSEMGEEGEEERRRRRRAEKKKERRQRKAHARKEAASSAAVPTVTPVEQPPITEVPLFTGMEHEENSSLDSVDQKPIITMRPLAEPEPEREPELSPESEDLTEEEGQEEAEQEEQEEQEEEEQEEERLEPGEGEVGPLRYSQSKQNFFKEGYQGIIECKVEARTAKWQREYFKVIFPQIGVSQFYAPSVVRKYAPMELARYYSENVGDLS